MKRRTLLAVLCLSGSVNLLAQGLIFDDESYQKVPQKGSILAVNQQLPKKIDLSMYAPTVIDQQDLGTCVGVSTTYYMRTILEAHRQQITHKDAVDALRFSPSYLYNAVKNQLDSTCQDGTQIEIALEYLKKNGVAKYSEQGYPYCAQNQSLEINPTSKILDYVKIFGLNYLQDSTVIATKKALTEATPVIVGIQTTASLDHLGKNGFWKNIWRGLFRFLGIEVLEEIGLWKPEKSTSLRSGHAVCVLGYDDNKFGGAFQAINSRGKYWGDEGYFWIRYDDFRKYVKYGFQAYLPTKNDTIQVKRSADVSINYPYKVRNESVFFEKQTINVETDSAINKQMATYSLIYQQYTGTSYRYNINVDKLTYLYVLEVNASFPHLTTKLFPLSDSVSAIIGADTKVVLPSEESLYALQAPTGTENWLFLFTEVEIDINAYLIKINEGEGNFTQRVFSAFGEDLVPYKQVDYQTKKMGFSLKGSYKGHIVPLLVSLKHTERRARVFSRTLR